MGASEKAAAAYHPGAAPTPPEAGVQALYEYERSVINHAMANVPTYEGDTTPDWLGVIAAALINARPLSGYRPAPEPTDQTREQCGACHERRATGYIAACPDCLPHLAVHEGQTQEPLVEFLPAIRQHMPADLQGNVDVCLLCEDQECGGACPASLYVVRQVMEAFDGADSRDWWRESFTEDGLLPAVHISPEAASGPPSISSERARELRAGPKPSVARLDPTIDAIPVSPETAEEQTEYARLWAVHEELISDHVDLQQAAQAVRAQVEAVLPVRCYVFADDPVARCTDLLGGGGAFENGSPWTEELCCLPCLVRAALESGARS